MLTELATRMGPPFDVLPVRTKIAELGFDNFCIPATPTCAEDGFRAVGGDFSLHKVGVLRDDDIDGPETFPQVGAMRVCNPAVTYDAASLSQADAVFIDVPTALDDGEARHVAMYTCPAKFAHRGRANALVILEFPMGQDGAVDHDVLLGDGGQGPGSRSSQIHILRIGLVGDARYLTDVARRAMSEVAEVVFAATNMGEPIRTLVRREVRWGGWFWDLKTQEWVRTAVEAGQRVAWLCAGDPALCAGLPRCFGSLFANAAWLHAQGLDFEVHPGVTSLWALLAKLGLGHARAESGCPMAIYAKGRDPTLLACGRMDSFAALDVPMALFLANQSISVLIETGARSLGPEGRIVTGHRMEWPDEWVVDSTLSEFARRDEGTELSKNTLLHEGPQHG